MGFSIQRWMLDYVTPPCKIIHVYYAEFIRGLITISMFAIMNTCTFIRMNFRRRKQGVTAFETTQQAKRRNMERAFVQQVTIQGGIYVLELLTYFYLSAYFPVDSTNIRGDPNRWQNFLLTTYAWILVHTIDGIVTLVFNRQFRKPIRKLFFKTKSTAVSKSSRAIGGDFNSR
ncbi:unnamed protein product [Cylicocyclus nassatus]|uniref:7TM GPCR serpentine receptor class x (Srx) domain-containing protein n=1 Tax=Cylicocyclus nassatus TaxID=53992 RepID=A0AA36GYG5_CYLNA|nr:unnamed protein product [Cylicocyclus nassatus]